MAEPGAVRFRTERGVLTVRNWGYQLQDLVPGRAVGLANDLIVMDSASACEDPEPGGVNPREVRFKRADIDLIRSANPSCVVLSYISVGEASDFRCHWNMGWTDKSGRRGNTAASRKLRPGKAPAYLGPWNPDWSNSRKVRYWLSEWQSELFNAQRTGWLDAIIDAGFDGAYLDIIDAYRFWGEEARDLSDRDDRVLPSDPQNSGDVAAALADAARRMVDLLSLFAHHARVVRNKPDFLIVPQNGAEIVSLLDEGAQARFFNAISAVAIESLYYAAPEGEGGEADDRYKGVNGPASDDEVRRELRRILREVYVARNAKPVLVVDYLSLEDHLATLENVRKRARFYGLAFAEGFLPYASPRKNLDAMGVACNRDIVQPDIAVAALESVPQTGESPSRLAPISRGRRMRWKRGRILPEEPAGEATEAPPEEPGLQTVPSVQDMPPGLPAIVKKFDNEGSVMEPQLDDLRRVTGYSAEALEDMAETLANRDRYILEEPASRLESLSPEEPPLTPAQAMAAISSEAYELIVGYETGGRAYYDNVIKERPIWPEYSSGITIGFGYDLGYNTKEEFAQTWKPLLSASDFERLLPCIGFKTTEPGRADKVQKARRFVRQLSDIIIPWGLGETVYQAESIPRFLNATRRALPNLLELHPHCAGVLLSLSFNRGVAYSLSGDRYREMRAIKKAMEERDFRSIPDQIRSMARLWTSAGLKKRRRDEAKLFEIGVGLMPLTVAGAVTEGVGAGGVAEAELPAFGRPEEGLPPEDDVFEPGEETLPADELEGVRAGVWYEQGDVSWPRDDNVCPDFRHLVGLSQAQTFSFSGDDLELLIAANAFEPVRDNGKILFGLRGAQLKDGTQHIGVPQLELTRARPDHRKFRCVIGVFDLATRALSGFTASTVPNAYAVAKCWQLAANNTPDEKLQGNMLPTGCYPYAVGTHSGVSRQVPGALLQGIHFDKRARLAVLRSKDDVSYTVNDYWQTCIPNDNIHCAFSDTSFSSLGCQTVKGTCVNGVHSGPWSEFRKAVGLSTPANPAEDNRRFDYVLLTGLDAAAASALRSTGAADPAGLREKLQRLRHGSRGEAVRRLQAALGVTQDGEFGHGLRAALVKLQSERLGHADGIYSPELEKLLGFAVFGQGPVAVAAVARSPGVAASLEAVAPMRAGRASAGSLEAVWEGNRAGRHVEAVLAAEDDDALLRQLGALTESAQRDPASAGDLEMVTLQPAYTEGIGDHLIEIGQRVYGRLEDELYRMLCGTDAADEIDRERVRAALQSVKLPGQGDAASAAAAAGKTDARQSGGDSGLMGDIVTTIASVLMGSAGVWYGPALIVAALFARRIAKVTLDETCKVWGQNRRKAPAPPPDKAAAAPAAPPATPAAASAAAPAGQVAANG